MKGNTEIIENIINMISSIIRDMRYTYDIYRTSLALASPQKSVQLK